MRLSSWPGVFSVATALAIATSASDAGAQTTAKTLSAQDCQHALQEPSAYLGTKEKMAHLRACTAPFKGLFEHLVVQSWARRAKELQTMKSVPQGTGSNSGPRQVASVKNGVQPETGQIVLGPNVQQAGNGLFNFSTANAQSRLAETVLPSGTDSSSQAPDPAATNKPSNAPSLTPELANVLNQLNQTIQRNRQSQQDANVSNAAATAAANLATAQTVTRGCPYQKNIVAASLGFASIARSVFLRDLAAVSGLLAPIPFSPCQQPLGYKPVISVSDTRPYVKEDNVKVTVTERNYTGAFTVSSNDTTILKVDATTNEKGTYSGTAMPLAQGSANIVATDDYGNQNTILVLVDAPRASATATLSDPAPKVGEANVTVVITEPGYTGGFTVKSSDPKIFTVTQTSKGDTFALTLTAAGTANLVVVDDNRVVTNISITVAK